MVLMLVNIQRVNKIDELMKLFITFVVIAGACLYLFFIIHWIHVYQNQAVLNYDYLVVYYVIKE